MHTYLENISDWPYFASTFYHCEVVFHFFLKKKKKKKIKKKKKKKKKKKQNFSEKYPQKLVLGIKNDGIGLFKVDSMVCFLFVFFFWKKKKNYNNQIK